MYMCDIFGSDNFTKNHKMVIQFMCQHHIQIFCENSSQYSSIRLTPCYPCGYFNDWLIQ